MSKRYNYNKPMSAQSLALYSHFYSLIVLWRVFKAFLLAKQCRFKIRKIIHLPFFLSLLPFCRYFHNELYWFVPASVSSTNTHKPHEGPVALQLHPSGQQNKPFPRFVSSQAVEGPLPISSLLLISPPIHTPTSTATPPSSINTAGPRVWII